MIDMALLLQVRAGIKAIIGESQERVILSRAMMVDDGFGGLVAEPSGARVPFTITGRISHESGGPATLASSSVGLSTSMGRYILVDHLTRIVEGDLFRAQGHGWRIERVDTLKKFGGIIGYQASLLEAEVVEVTT